MVCNVPQRESGMSPYEVLLSESQERMLLVASQDRKEEVFEVFKKWGLDAVQVGHVTDDGLLRVWTGEEKGVEVPNVALVDDGPLYRVPGKNSHIDQTLFTEKDALSILEFVNTWNSELPIVVHCWCGISRSMATETYIMCSLDSSYFDKNVSSHLILYIVSLYYFVKNVKIFYNNRNLL